MAMFEVDSDVGLPDGKIGKGRNTQYPWPTMNVGDSCVFPGKACTSNNKYYNSALAWGRNNGVKFTGRALGDGTIRIWRIE